jgi:hypothetical protein
MRRRLWYALAVTAILAGSLVGAGSATAAPARPGPPDRPAPAPRPGPDGSSLADPAGSLPAGWQRSTDRAVATVADLDGLHVLVADEKDGYAWHTAATLAEPGFDADSWIGQACLTGSGSRAVVVYAPRTFTNHESLREGGAFAAIVDLGSGTVTKLAQRTSLAYHNPGCGTGEDVILSTREDGAAVSTRLAVVNGATGALTRLTRTPGELTSAVPFAGGVAAALGNRIVAVDSRGATHVLSEESGGPFRLHPDPAGGLAYQVPSGDRVGVRRLWRGRSTLVGTGRLGQVQVAGSAGQVFLIGPDTAGLTVPPAWSRLAAPANATVSSTGALVLTRLATRRPGTVTLDGTVTGTGRRVAFTVDARPARPDQGRAASPALAPSGVDSTETVDPDAGCAVPRNDPHIQTLQPTAHQVEWAADLAVRGQLTITRPVNWMGSGMPLSWTPQGMFPRHNILGNAQVPVQLLLGVLAQESNTMQASPHAVDGVTGNVNQGGFYGDGITWAEVDCGYGVGQITTGMSKADGDTVYTPQQRQAIATDYASNVAASLNALIDKWNQVNARGLTVNNGDGRFIENWYLAAWAYNTGVQPDGNHGNTTGCAPGPLCDDGAGHWGLGWSNNPANPNYPVDRGVFQSTDDFDTRNPQLWPYQEKVIGWAATPVRRYDYSTDTWEPAYQPGNWVGAPRLAPPSTFCTAANSCVVQDPSAPNGLSTGECQLGDLHCWWHEPNVAWVDCAPGTTASPCGTDSLPFPPGSGEPANASVYPPDCAQPGLLASASIVDEVTVPSTMPCAKSWSDSGSFALSFPYRPDPSCTSSCINYPGKIDFHQLSTGFGGHLWFTHTAPVASVTATWIPPSTTTGWTRIKVHIPQSGATTRQADYQISLGDGTFRHRVVNQGGFANTWVDLGAFNLAAGASVSLSNASPNIVSFRADGGDIAFDAVAFIPSTAPVASYVALGDSYSSGESNTPFDPDSDVQGTDQCHRSTSQAFPRQVRLPGASSSIAALAADNRANFHLLACSGAGTFNLTQNAVNPANTDNTLWRAANYYRFGEVDQIDDSGWLDADTTLVTITAGGNDIGFPDVLLGCESLTSTCDSPTFHLTRDMFGYGVDPQPLATYEPYLIGQLRSRLVSTYLKIHEKAPHAKILVLGYPALVGTTDTALCSGIEDSERTFLDGLAGPLAQTIDGAVADARSAVGGLDITFIDVMSVYSGHAACGPDPWLRPVVFSNLAYSFHPNATGQAAYADLVNAHL